MRDIGATKELVRMWSKHKVTVTVVLFGPVIWLSMEARYRRAGTLGNGAVAGFPPAGGTGDHKGRPYDALAVGIPRRASAPLDSRLRGNDGVNARRMRPLGAGFLDTGMCRYEGWDVKASGGCSRRRRDGRPQGSPLRCVGRGDSPPRFRPSGFLPPQERRSIAGVVGPPGHHALRQAQGERGGYAALRGTMPVMARACSSASAFDSTTRPV